MLTARVTRCHRSRGAARSFKLLPAMALVFLSAVCTAPSTAAAEQNASPILVELFTSQGCSSCPPADTHLSKLAEQRNLVALSYNVDYWDYLGWRDTLAKAAFTERQRAYARARGDGQIYTPQLIVNGRAHTSGANIKAVTKLLADANVSGAVSPAITAAKSDGVTHVRVGSMAGPKRKATVWIATVRRKVVTKISRGENRGRKLMHHNVVRQMIPLGVWMGEATSYQLDIGILMKDGAEACAIIIQEGEAGPVIAAAWLQE